MDFDGILSQALVIKCIAVFGEIDMFEGTNYEADMLWKDKCIAGKARCLPSRVGRIENLYVLAQKHIRYYV